MICRINQNEKIINGSINKTDILLQLHCKIFKKGIEINNIVDKIKPIIEKKKHFEQLP
jgi:hypothetical protein